MNDMTIPTEPAGISSGVFQRPRTKLEKLKDAYRSVNVWLAIKWLSVSMLLGVPLVLVGRWWIPNCLPFGYEIPNGEFTCGLATVTGSFAIGIVALIGLIAGLVFWFNFLDKKSQQHRRSRHER